jgi:hypothetical protein
VNGFRRSLNILSSQTAAGQFDREYVSPAVLVDPDGHQYRLAAHRTVFAHLVVARIQNQIRVRFP